MNGEPVVRRVSARIRADDITTVAESIRPEVVEFDLTEVTIMDREVVTFFARRERQGIRWSSILHARMD